MNVNRVGGKIEEERAISPGGRIRGKVSRSRLNRDSSAPLWRWAARIRPTFWLRLVDGVLLFAILALLGGSAPDGLTLRDQRLTVAVGGYTFDLVGWEVGALREKAGQIVQGPADAIPANLQPALVMTYLDRARRIGEMEGQINRLLAEDGQAHAAQIDQLQAEETRLRQEQEIARPAVEQIIQRQVGGELIAAGFNLGTVPVPPVQFTFTEPPKKMVASPRDRIETVYSRMLTAEMPLTVIEEREAAILADEDLAAYITNIGGLGAYPTMVVDRAPLGWVLNTVAHEWVHNYLTLFPLGWNYNASPEITTINETVADIVGDEIGDRVLRRHYPDQVPPDPEPQSPIPELDPLGFDFSAEMRTTRLEVDRLLADGDVAGAEAYMEARRLVFVENGYNLRVLNQGYFAFHGSYATGAASSSPIGPLLQELRKQMPDLHAFLVAVRGVTSQAEVEALLK